MLDRQFQRTFHRYQQIRLRLEHNPRYIVDVELLRDCAWLEDNHAHVGGTVWLNMPEMGVEGLAEVLAIEPCPPVEEGEGRLVTGTFRHTSGEVYDLKLESESKPVGVTGTHPFWSVDRKDWVSAADLEIGETLKTMAGTTVVESRTKREELEAVYNIEVEGEHCYRVGESGVLVHNASINPSYGSQRTITFTNQRGQSVSAEVGTSAEIILTAENIGGPRHNLSEPSWWDDLEDVAGSSIQKGHILASSLGGTESGAKNLTPLYVRPNTPAMNTCEGFMRRLITTCNYCSVQLTITVNGYGGNQHAPASAKPVMPTSVTMTWQVLDGQDGPIGTFVIQNDPQINTQDPCRAGNLPCRQ